MLHLYIIICQSYVYFWKLYHICVPWHFQNKLLWNGTVFCVHLININTTLITGTLRKCVTELSKGNFSTVSKPRPGITRQSRCAVCRRVRPQEQRPERGRGGLEQTGGWNAESSDSGQGLSRVCSAPRSRAAGHGAAPRSHTGGLARPTPAPPGGHSAGTVLGLSGLREREAPRHGPRARAGDPRLHSESFLVSQSVGGQPALRGPWPTASFL